MRRKVVQSGPNTLGISLPSKWVHARGLKKGDELDIDESDGSLLINSNSEKLFETVIHIPIKDLPLDKNKRPDIYIIRTIVINALRKGYNKLKINYDSPSVLRQIIEITDQVLGYEITSQTSSECIIENVVQLIETDFTKQFIKLRHVISNFTNLCDDYIIKNNGNFEEISSAFSMLEKSYNNFCRFLLAKSSEKIKEKVFLFASIEHLYQGARNLFYAAKLFSNRKTGISSSSLKYSEEAFEYIRDTLDFISSKDLKKITDLNVRKNKLTFYEINELFAKKDERLFLLQLVFACRRMWDSVGPFVGYIS